MIVGARSLMRVPAEVSRTEEICIKNEEFVSNTRNLCYKNEEFVLKITNFAGEVPRLKTETTHRVFFQSSGIEARQPSFCLDFWYLLRATLV